MARKTLLFAPAAFNLAETSRMVEIAKAIARHPAASQIFDIHFISDGGDFEQLIEKHSFRLTRLNRVSRQKRSSSSPKWTVGKSLHARSRIVK